MSILFVSAQSSLKEDSENNAFYIRDGMDRVGLPIAPFSPSKLTRAEVLRLGPRKVQQRMRGFDYRLSLHPSVLQRQGREVAEAAAGIQADLIVANAPYVVSRLPSSAPPLVLYMDAPSAAFIEMGHYYDGWDQVSRSRFVTLDRETIERASLVVYHSRWAVEQAINHYGLPASKFEYITPGANLPFICKGKVQTDPPGEPLRLLFFGREWVRKGGERAIQIVDYIRRQGVDAELIVSGPISIPETHLEQPWVTFLGRLSKTTAEGIARIEHLFQTCHFLLAPTFAESSTAALREAAGYGLPSVSTLVGAHEEIMTPGRDSILLPGDSTTREFADTMLSVWRDPSAYTRLRVRARETYEQRLTWDSAIATLSKKLSDRNLLHA